VKREHWLDSLQPSQTSVVMLQTGIAAMQPVIAQLGSTHWWSTHASPVAHDWRPSNPFALQSASSRQHTAGFARVHAARVSAITQKTFIAVRYCHR
jgi:hypothetical protein